MGLILGIIALIVVAILAYATIGVAIGLMGFVFMLLIAAVVGALADAIVPGRIPYGWLGSIAAGLVGSWLGTMLLGDFGPVIAGIPILPAFIGAIIFAFVLELILGSTRRTELD